MRVDTCDARSCYVPVIAVARSVSPSPLAVAAAFVRSEDASGAGASGSSRALAMGRAPVHVKRCDVRLAVPRAGT